ncbi:2-succinyl-6-hydroxy-2,4-cyclohexadiene-1-carboxylate synthase [Alkalibacillus almallahensis]|uniref:2-succinyl-6-hydroxy-2, 4-cyclohexadiene-1-carboxylate synthase n=1 Tax=Alkalibacillus almallahensis TaxID=1379154 RepID=UPI00141E64D1|nr:2-succinyl-6-hydroxy-2,4-cyclohexadiene-1-carboxylate synthase [Alkalibacillus almallahensis]NIK12140.1 2-succinyl-6-hydroxy-2,4-cyclohexadiene-1-carboxylate synthase [Alkalibacillus almallahensis]
MYITVGDHHYHVNVIGEGTPLVLLHGFTGTLATWNEIISYLEVNRQLVLIDLPGHGQTDAKHVSNLSDVCHDLKSIIHQLGHNHFDLLGYSMGGRTALMFVHYFPEMVNQLILVGASPGLSGDKRLEREAQDQKLANMIEREGIESFVDYWERVPLFATQKRLSSAKQEQIREERLSQAPEGLALSLRTMGTGKQASLWESLGQLTTETLLVVGEEDEKFVLINEQMHESLQNAQFRKISQTGHAVYLESPKIFGKIVSEFLTKSDSI